MEGSGHPSRGLYFFGAHARGRQLRSHRKKLSGKGDRTPPPAWPNNLGVMAEIQSEPVAPRLAAVREQLSLLADYL